MKRHRFIALATVLSVGLFFASCETVDVDNDQQVAQIAAIVKSGTQLAVTSALVKRPELAPHFLSAVTGIKAAINDSTLTPAEVLAVVNRYVDVSGSGFYPLVESGIGLALNVYKTFYDTNVGDNIDAHLKTILVAIHEGISAGVVAPRDLVADFSRNPLLDLKEEDLKLKK